jgi:hypothetical protein
VLGWALSFALAVPAAADSVTGQPRDGYGRLAFSLSAPATVTASTTGGVLAIGFGRKTDLDPATIVAALPRILTGGHADPGGRTLRFTLVAPVKLHVSQLDSRAVVDLAAADFTGTMPDLKPLPKPAPKPLDIASLPEIKLRTGSYSHFTRLVFDWNKAVAYSVFPGAGRMTIKFAAPARLDVSALTRFAPPWVKNAAWRIDGDSTICEFDIDAASGYHDFKDGHHIVLDVLAPKTDGAAYAPPGAARPAITLLPKAGASPAQLAAIAAAAAKLAPPPKPAPQKTASVNPAAPGPDTKPETPTDEAAAAPPPAAIGQRTRQGVRLTFRGEARTPGAVFVRGLTAWIVLKDNVAFDAAALKKQLGDYPAGIEASSNSGLSILRVALRNPVAISASAAGADLQVEIGTEGDAAPIHFARNQADPNRASLSTLVPAADGVFALADPESGDVMSVIPGLPGQAMRAPRTFAAFAALPTASGLVIMPFADGLSVTAADGRVVISTARGLALTPPQMPVAQSPAALAHFGDGPSWLDFAAWGRTDGSMLATERRLAQAIAHTPPDRATPARLALARFYLAHRFAAEALGLIDIVQTGDPALRGDAQLATMRAAADYMMGRYRDAHNALAAPAFDADRHAAFWRGLIDAKMENWRDAHLHLEQAAPVLARYPAAWRAAAILADANAALGIARLDLADAALARLPKALPSAQALAAQLVRARLKAAEGRYDDAAPLFGALEKGGDEKLAAAAIYYQTDAALKAHAISDAQAIEQLEKLRFRWRGDGLELKTLRRLAGLYFKRKAWREGLKTLRVATESFSGPDSIKAQDDMRAAFVNLYLKGGADTMKPVEQLGLFYDNIDLTPIGPDGDEMIRRMADRLVAVDLLEPAAKLLAYQVDKRLDGIAKAQVATRLAAVYLMDRKPGLAVAALRESQITGLPDPVLHERMLLEARAFAGLKQWDNALDLIAADPSADTRRLRADIYWESGNWASAGQKAEELMDGRWADPAPLTGSERAMILRAAVAYSLAGDQTSLERLAGHFAAAMKATPDANMFAVLSAPIDMHGLAFRSAAAKIASVDTLTSFMKDLGQRHALLN